MSYPWETEEYFKWVEETRKRFPLPTKTNFDWIRSRSVEELANVLTDDWCEILCGSPSVCDGQCEGKMLSWLKAPVEEVDK